MRYHKAHRAFISFMDTALIAVLALVQFFFVPNPPANAIIANGAPAIDVMGQYVETFTTSTTSVTPNFAKNGANNGAGVLGLSGPDVMTLDGVAHRLFVVDQSNNRVLVFNLNINNTLMDRVPDFVLGQPNFATAAPDAVNAGQGCTTTPNACGMRNPAGGAFDPSNNRLFITDSTNNRILVFDVASITNGEAAVAVLGQPDFTTSSLNTQNAGQGCTTAINACGMSSPGGLAFSASGNRLYSIELINRRVLVFDVASITNGEAAVNVLGQPDFVTNSVNTQNAGQGCTTTPNACGMSQPSRIILDAAGNRLFASEQVNSRVLVFDVASITNGEAAVNVLGQPDFTTSTANTLNAGQGCTTTPNACGMNFPSVGAFDPSNNRLFVADPSNNRILVFDAASITNGEAAAAVLGQPDLVTNTLNTQNAGQGCTTSINACGMSAPSGVLPISAGKLLVSDRGNSRILVIDDTVITNGEPATDLIGQYVNNDPSSVTFTKNGANNGPDRVSFQTPRLLVMDAVHHRLFVSDSTNNRVLVYNLHDNNTLQDHLADFVLGQPGFTTAEPNTLNTGLGCTTAPNACGLRGPWGLAYDASNDRLFVSDVSNNRIVVFDVVSITNGEAAVGVLGQPDFVTSTANTQNAGLGCTTTPNACGISGPREIAYDASNKRLFSVELGRRVLVFDVTSITNGEAAVNVLGQPDFTTGTANTQNAGQGCTTTPNACGLSQPAGLILDAAGNRLFVGEQLNNRFLVFNVASITNGEAAVNVLGQPDFVTGSTNTQNAGNGCTTTPNACGMSFPNGGAFDPSNNRLFTTEVSNNRVLVFDVATIANGEAAVAVLGQPDFASSTINTQNAGSGCTTTPNACGLSSPGFLLYESGLKRLFVPDVSNNRIMVFDVSTTTGTVASTVTNRIGLSRLKAGASSVFDISFTLTHNLSSTLTVTFPAGFTVTSAATGGSGCLSGFGFTANTLTATKSNCAGPITMTGATVTNPATPGTYNITWVNDDPGGGSVIITSEDQLTITAAVDPYMTFNAGAQASATACNGTFVGSGGTVALGVLSTTAISSSDASSVPHICTRTSTNGGGGAAVTVKSLNAGLKSTSAPADVIPTGTTTLVAGTAGYGICAGSAGADSGADTTSPTSAVPARSAPFNGSCTASAHAVGGLTGSSQNVWTIASPSQNAFTRIYVKAAIGTGTPAHDDYTDTLTFVATGTY